MQEVDWADLAEVRREWPRDEQSVDADLAAWREGGQLYADRNDYASMIRAGGLLCRALRHELHGSGPLDGTDLPTTVHRVLFAASTAPPDGQTLSPEAARQLRLALTIVKKHGWQSPAMGGDGMMEEFISARFMIFSAAVAPRAREPWTGDLRDFFTRNPIAIADEAPGPEPLPVRDTEQRPMDQMIANMQAAIDQADAGDAASEARLRAIGAGLEGHDERALELFEEAARLGSVEAMYEAGCMARDLGRPAETVRWFETAAAAGHRDAQYNLGSLAFNDGDLAAARRHWERAAEMGDPSAFAALTQLASDAGDDAAERRWAAAGADAGHPFCLMRHAQMLMAAAPDDRATFVDRAIPLLHRAAEAGQEGAQFLLGIAYGSIDDTGSARLWLQRAEAAGDADATRVLRQQGLV